MIEILSVIWRWKKPLFVACILAGVASVVVSLMMDNYYESTSTMFATNPYRMDRQYLFSKEPGKNPVYDLGGSSEIDRFISVCNSRPLQDYIIDKFDLMNHYDVDTDDPLKEFKVRKEFLSNYNVIKNALDAIEITMKDYDPIKAADMVNAIVDKADALNLEINNMVSSNIMNVFSELKLEKEMEFTLLSDSLDQLNRKGLGSKADLLEGILATKTEELAEVSDLYDQYKSTGKRTYSTVYILDKAAPALKKAGPKRTLIVLGTILATLFLATLTVLFIEQMKKSEF